MHKMHRLEQHSSLTLNWHTLVRLSKLLLLVFTFAHWNSCAQFYISSSFDTVTVNGTTTLPRDSWIIRAHLVGRSPFEQWSWSYYHAIIQLLGIGEGTVPPRRLVEVWTFNVSILLGASMYAIFVASLTSAIGELGFAGRRYRARIDTLGEWMRQMHMPTSLRDHLVKYFELRYPRQQVLDDEVIKNELSHPLRFRVALYHCHSVLESLQVLHDESLSRAVATSLQHELFVDGDVIIHEREEVPDLDRT